MAGRCPWLLAAVAALLGCLTVAVRPAQALGTYTVVAPRVLRPNTDYHVAVTTQSVGQPTTVTLEVSGRQDSGGNPRIVQSIVVEPYSTRTARMEIGDLGPGSYKLSARGVGGLEFENSTELNYMHKSFSVFIQTDKGIYKPGHTVHFRVVVLNAHLKPSVTHPLDIYVSDGKGNRVKQWKRVSVSRGVFAADMELSQSPVLGDWNITVSVLDQSFTQGFQVAEYVLPNFEVTADVPKHTTFKEGKIVATIRAKYTYGKPVRGEATVTAYPVYYSNLLQPIFETPVRKVVPIDGKALVDFDFEKELKLNGEYTRQVQLDVIVEEALTLRRQNISTQVTVHNHKYNMELIKTSKYFKPGLKYTAFVKLAHHDGSPVQDDINLVTIRYGFSYDVENYTSIQKPLPRSGIIQLDFYPPTNVSMLGIEAQYLDLKEWFSTMDAALSPSNSFIQALLVTEKPKVNEDVEIEVNSTVPLTHVSYQVLGRGDIAAAHSIILSGQRTTRFRFLATHAMAPAARVLIHSVDANGEVLADTIDVELDGLLQNFVELSVSPSQTEPGRDVELRMQCKPNSYIGLLGVDQSVLLLQSGNDITQDDVERELRSYDPEHVSSPTARSLRLGRSMFWRPGSATAQEVFDNSGTVILTNGRVMEPLMFEFFSRHLDGGMSPSAMGISPLAAKAMYSNSVSEESGGVPRVRKNFPETWLWETLDSGSDGRATIKRAAPDSITSWVISAFSVDPLYGLGLSAEPSKLTIFRPFFVSIDLPYSVIRGEIVAIPIVVFNYMDKDLSAEVTLENTGDFEFAEVSNDVNAAAPPKLELYRRKRVTVRSQNGASASFMITPRELGYITIKVSAVSERAGDAVERKLLVKAEGETQYKNKAILVDLRGTSSFMTNVTLDMPKNIVSGSEKIEVSAVGDILGPSIPNLDGLIRMPHGCGEQNMLNFVPNIVIIDYLKNTRQLSQAVENKARTFMEVGYQQELTYRHEDGSFSAFGNSDPSGSTWLTAFVAKSFRQAQALTNIEDRIVEEALQWLADHQAANGSFPEVGKVSHTDMQGGAGRGLALTAYVLTTFLYNQQFTSKYRNTINKAVDYIVRNLNSLEDPYSIAITTYALHLALHPTKEAAFNLLESKAHSTSDQKWWNKTMTPGDEKNPWHSEPNALAVEMTSYALLTYLQRGLIGDSIPIMHWLISQRNANGGFASTQDTVIGMQALAALAERISSAPGNVVVSFSYRAGGGQTTRISINRVNSMILQKQEIPRKVREVEISAAGSGFALVQVSYSYNVNVTGAWPLFTLDPQVDKNSDSNHLQLSICSGFVPGSYGNESNMAVMEVTLPSGFTADRDALPSLEQSQNVRRVETRDADTVVVLYFDKMVRREYCPTVSAYRTHRVARQKPVPVTVYDYYDQSRRARVFYEPRVMATLCDICEDDDCGSACTGSLLGPRTGDRLIEGRDEAAGVVPSLLSVLLAALLVLRQ